MHQDWTSLADQPKLTSVKGTQDWLIKFENPLKKRFKEIYSEVPKGPGVYFFYGREDELLYVGKAKNLNRRLRSYSYANPSQVSKKVLNLISSVRRLDWKECENEEAALLEENRLLRERKPYFNRMNKMPEFYSYLAYLHRTDSFRFEIIRDAEKTDFEGHFFYGPFKSRRSLQRVLNSLVRLLRVLDQGNEREVYASVSDRLVNKVRFVCSHRSEAARSHSFSIDRWIQSYFEGASLDILGFIELQLFNEKEKSFLQTLMEQDIEVLRDFFEWGPSRNRRLIEKFAASSSPREIAPERLDDWLVSERFTDELS